MTFEASIPYSEYLARTRIEEERNKRAFTGEEPLEPEEMRERERMEQWIQEVRLAGYWVMEVYT